jgi:hypothetical protein
MAENRIGGSEKGYRNYGNKAPNKAANRFIDSAKSAWYNPLWWTQPFTDPIIAGTQHELGIEPTQRAQEALQAGIQSPKQQVGVMPVGDARLGSVKDPLAFNDGLTADDLRGIYTNPERIVGPMPASGPKRDPNSLQFEDGGFLTEADHRNYNLPAYGPPAAKKAVGSNSAFARRAPAYNPNEVIQLPEQRYATVDPLNLFGNRNGINPFASSPHPITMSRFNGGVVPSGPDMTRGQARNLGKGVDLSMF